jgi:2-(1,2-epoxy-1,2-dihydrophenyl)acetyl-CoA isomerase
MGPAQDIVIHQESGITSITLNRPQVKNALTFAMCRELIALFRGLREDAATRVVLLRGSGSDFSSGADLNDVSTILDGEPKARSEAAMHQVHELSLPLFLAMGAVPQPVVSSVRGYAVGAGMQMALMSDMVIAAESAKFVLPQVRLGHNVDHGESWALPRKVGMGRAMQLMALGDSVNGRDAERFGIANWVVDDGALEQKTEEVVNRLASSPTVAIREMKKLLRDAPQRSLQEQLEAEARALGVCAATEDFAEAIGAFLAKRKPTFKGR